ncbi:glutathione S-transferase [Phanerochaete sordida]|uniref:Glutathione S-transferase n=1 Tax=Phanerochaete sordida TaxID=48140 RepID=A0A9P3LMX0_9APHY|nr:glutathione S-transferase [Phanerochaete sordida]
MEPIVFYDIPAREPACMAWSPNTWRTRYALNYKGLSYKTEWVEYPDIEALCKKIGAPPTEKKPDGSDHYTFPVIFDPNTQRVVADSGAIAEYLDAAYPDTPKLFPSGTRALQAAFHQLLRPSVMLHIRNSVLLRVCQNLRPRSQEYFRRTREEGIGRTLEQAGSEKDWPMLVRGLTLVKECLDANGEEGNVLLMGDRICFADIQLAAMLTWMRVSLGENSEQWRKLLSLHEGRWAQFMERFSKYQQVDF